MARERKKFKDTAVGQFIGDRLPGVVDAVGDMFPPAKLLKALVGKEDLSPEDRYKFMELVRKYETEDYQTEVEDRMDARATQREAMKSDDKFVRRWLYWFAVGSILLGFVYVFLVTFVEVPDQNLRFADTVLGVVISLIFAGIYNFFFGSSKGSMDKTEIMKK